MKVIGAEITVDRIPDVIRGAAAIDAAVHFQGDSGIGKTEQVKAACRQIGLDVHVLNLGDTLLEDIGSYRVDQERRVLETYVQPIFVWEGRGRPALFLDEANRAGRDIRCMLAKMVTERRVLGHALPEDLVIIAASNPAEQDFADVEDFWGDLATVRRWCVVNVRADANVWLAWAGRNQVDERVVSFIRQFPGLLVTGQACPRSWVKVSKLIQLEPELVPLLGPGLLGSVWPQFAKFLGSAEIFTAKDVLTRYHQIRDKLVKDPDQMLRVANELVAVELEPLHKAVVLAFLKDLPAEAQYATILKFLQSTAGKNSILVGDWVRKDKELFELIKKSGY